MGLSVRQIERLVAQSRVASGPAPISKKRGRPSNHRLSESFRCQVLALGRARHADSGPTLAQEKLLESHQLKLGVETLPTWMINDGLWTPCSQRGQRVHQPCHRRACLGELIQIDGSDHEWFEDRASRCTFYSPSLRTLTGASPSLHAVPLTLADRYMREIT